MKLTVTKDALLEGLLRTQNMVSMRPTQPVLSNVLLKTVENNGLQLTTTDSSASIQCLIPAQIEQAGATSLPVRRLTSIIRELSSGEISLETDSKNLSFIQSAGSKFKMFGISPEQYPKLPELTDAMEISLKQTSLRDGLRRTAYAISLDETRYVLNGILFALSESKLTLVATDGRRLALYETELELPRSQEREFIVPTKAITELQRILTDSGEVKVFLTPNIVAFDLGTTLLITKLVDGNYPNYRQVIPNEVREKIKLEREIFLNCVRRVSLLTVDKTTSTVRLNFSKDNIEIVSVTPEVGEARESLPIAYRGRDLSIAFNPEFLMDPLRNIPDEQVDLDLIDEMSPGVIRTPIGANFLYVLMPMRVSL